MQLLTFLDLSKNELRNARIQVLASDPASPVEGQVYYNSTDDALKVYTGAAWLVFGRLDQFVAPTGPVGVGGQRITSVGTPTAGTDAANKDYVDALTAGVAWKDAVRAATTANITLSGAQTIDGVSVIAGDRVLVKNQTTAADNGIYIAASGAWARAGDADADGDLRALSVFVEEGTANADTGWILTTNGPITVGTTGLAFAKFASIVSSGTVNKFAADVGNGSATSIGVSHNLNTRDVVVSVHRTTTPWDTVYPDVERTDLNTVTLVFAVAPTNGQYRVVVTG